MRHQDVRGHENGKHDQTNEQDERGGQATDTEFSSIVFLGESLTDNGNLFAATGFPSAPYWQGRFPNGPTLAEQLPNLLGVVARHVQNFAFGGATTEGTTAIDLDSQLKSFIAGLGGHQAAKGTEAVLNIGNNDYLNYSLASGLPPPVEGVVTHSKSAIDNLSSHGVEKIVLFTLPDFSISPASHSTDAVTVSGADAIIAANNQALRALTAAETAAGNDVVIVDTNVLGIAVGAEFHAFGLLEAAIPVLDANGQATGVSNNFAPNEIAFFDALHPTTAVHGI